MNRSLEYHCTLPFCSSHQKPGKRHPVNLGKNVKLFQFPLHGSSLWEKWMEKCKLPKASFDADDVKFLCNLHFEENVTMGKHYLYPSAVPTLFLSADEGDNVNIKIEEPMDHVPTLVRTVIKMEAPLDIQDVSIPEPIRIDTIAKPAPAFSSEAVQPRPMPPLVLRTVPLALPPLVAVSMNTSKVISTASIIKTPIIYNKAAATAVSVPNAVAIKDEPIDEDYGGIYIEADYQPTSTQRPAIKEEPALDIVDNGFAATIEPPPLALIGTDAMEDSSDDDDGDIYYNESDPSSATSKNEDPIGILDDSNTGNSLHSQLPTTSKSSTLRCRNCERNEEKCRKYRAKYVKLMRDYKRMVRINKFLDAKIGHLRNRLRAQTLKLKRKERATNETK